MRRSLFITLEIFILLFLFSKTEIVAQTMEDYCQLPPFVSQVVEPNILFVIDVSGSMGWKAYSYGDSDSNGDGILDGYNPAVSYEGYFDPDKYYTTTGDPDGAYHETTPTGNPCTCTCVRWRCRYYNWGGCQWHGGGCSRWGCCIEEECSGDCNVETGNYLNYLHMARIDLVRWALTGGTPATCTGSATFNKDSCDPELWSQPGNNANGKVGTVCNDNLDINGDSTADGGCILLTDDGEKVKVPWNRVNAGLAFKFKGLALKPRMAVMFYSGSSVRAQKVYMGDFTAPNSTNEAFPYMNLITHVNSAQPSGSTPTGPAMWDALNYYAQKSPEYGGFSPQSGEEDRWKNPMYVCEHGGKNCDYIPCANNFVILLSDGQWNTGGGPPATYTCSIDTGYENHSADPVVPAYKMHMGFQNIKTGVTINVSAVYTLGLFLGGTGEQSMKNVAMYGSFDNKAKTWPDSLSTYPNDTCSMADCGSGKGSPCEPLPSSSSDWDKDGNGKPDTFYKADSALEIKDTILDAILDILRRTASGTAVSILASGEGSGANLLQAFFYPKKVFEDMEIDWVGEMQNLWYYLDPTLQSSTIREDTNTDKILDLLDDYIVHFRFDSGLNKTRADRYNNEGVYQNTVDLEDVKNLWEAGKKLWVRDASERTIYTSINGSSFTEFSTTNKGVLQNFLQVADITEAEKIINYIHGIDQTGYRNRTVTIPSYDSTPRVWKLGDIISSTPKLQSWVALNNYHLLAPYGYSDSTYQKFIDSNNYKDRGMVYVGSNSGMLHAFKLGMLKMVNNPSDPDQKAELTDSNLGNLGKEIWAYIPKNSLPYLKYLTDTDYCHIYYVDASPYLVDASIAKPSDCSGTDYWECQKKTKLDGSGNLDLNETSWRTVLIGGMGLGGACRKLGTSCSDCVKTPALDPSDTTKGLGYSSYFAIDVTDPNNPSLMWEFSDDGLGFSTSGPVIVRTGDKGKNGRWFAVFASGPTGPIDTSSHQFYGRSDQNLRLFILDLKTGALVRTIVMDGTNGTPNIPYAFAGSISNTTIDTDRRNSALNGNYQDDVFYVGYVKKDTSTSTWTKGGVLRVTTKESTDPNQWVLSTLIDNIGPVTSSVSHLQDRKNHALWLYFGTGRYFYKIGTDIDDADSQRAIYGIKEPCYNKLELDRFDPECSASAGSPSLATETGTDDPDGWYINLDPPTSSLKAERVITNPLAAFTGAVFFTTFAPTADVCGFGGNTYLWAVYYSTGGAPSSTAFYGTALVQVSTGEIKEIALSSAFTEKGGRRTAGFQGVPPKGQGLTVVIKPQPIKKILHMQER
ncbi:MAG: pilus assembly protein [Thermodesulfovibrionales bacterium]